MKVTQSPLYMGLGITLVYILGILSVIIFLAVRKRCKNRKAQAWFWLQVMWPVSSGPVWAGLYTAESSGTGSILDILTISQNLNKMKQTWLDECERASIAASNMNLVSPRSVRTMTPALYQPPPVYAAGDYEFPLAGSNLPRPNKYELKRTLSTRSVGPQVSYIARNKSLCARWVMTQFDKKLFKYFTDPIQYQAPARPLRQPTTPRRLFVHEE